MNAPGNDTRASGLKQSCGSPCAYFSDGWCAAFQISTTENAGSNCSAYYQRPRGEWLPWIDHPAESELRNWACFIAAQDRLPNSKSVIPLLVTGGEKDFDYAFEKFCRLTEGNTNAIPLFLTLPDVQKPDAVPAELILSVLDLAKAKERVEYLTHAHKDNRDYSAWALLDSVFDTNIGRFWLTEGTAGTEQDHRIREGLAKVLIPPPPSEKTNAEGQSVLPVLNHEEIVRAEWEALFGDPLEGTVTFDGKTAIGALAALLNLDAKPDILVLDDLLGRAAQASRQFKEWQTKRETMESIFKVSAPVIPVLARHEKNPDELLPLIRAEIARLSRPLAAIVDLNWLFADTGERSPYFGLELIRIIREAKPSLPIFVWSPIQDKAVLQRAMQLGAASYFDKEESLIFGHEQSSLSERKDSGDKAFEKKIERQRFKNLLTPAKLWFRILAWEHTRYRIPPIEGCGRAFLLEETRETKKEREKFLKTFKLSEGKLLAQEEPDVERLLRALVPEAAQVEILRLFGEGRSGSEPPFIVRGKTRSGRWLRPVQIKISRDWRALAREGKGYRDVFAGALGPSVAHVEAGPYRLKEWSAMSQSFAAPEEAIREIGTKSTRSLSDWLRKNLWKPDICRQLVDELFDGVLDPFYGDNLEKQNESVVRAFERVTPAHLEATFTAAPEAWDEADIDLTPDTLSLKDANARRGAAYRAWQEVEKLFAGISKNEVAEGDKSHLCVIRGMVIDTLEVDDPDPLEWRLRLLDRTLGVKIDLKAGSHEVARRWRSLADSPIKLRGLPVSFALGKKKLKDDLGKDEIVLLRGWGRSVLKKLRESGLCEEPLALASDGQKPSSPEYESILPDPLPPFERIKSYFYPIHPLDWTEEFHIGPTHGDLNLGNILLHQKGDSYFPWLIDFDKAEENRPVVFDLAKLEIEAYHKLGQELYWELAQMGCAGDSAPKRDQRLRGLLRDFEMCLEREGVESIDHLWERFLRGAAVPESLRLRFTGFFAYLRQVHERVFKLGISRREFLIGRAVYCFCCIKFKHLYEAKSHPNAPFPAKILLWKLDSLLDALDLGNGIPTHPFTPNSDEANILQVVLPIRKARINASCEPVMGVLVGQKWEKIFRSIRSKASPGEGRWFREALWHARDRGVAATAEQLADFTISIAKASIKEGDPLEAPMQERMDYASTGRAGNVYPTLEMFRVLATKPDAKLVKMSTRGDSGGTIDILEQAGVPLCASRSAVSEELEFRGWTVATTSKDICEVDKVLWDLRKQTGCMKVADLVIASISAKKLSVGISDFAVQVASGYDAKITEIEKYLAGKKSGDGTDGRSPESLEAWWRDVWMLAKGTTFTLADPQNGFATDSLITWFDEVDGMDQAVFGTALLAAQIWKHRLDWQPQLMLRMPAIFCEKMAQYSALLESIQQFGDEEERTEGKRMVFHLGHVDSPAHLDKLSCWTIDDLHRECESMRDIRIVYFKFTHDIRHRVIVPFFDALYSDISKKHGHELTAIVFGKAWIAMVLPKAGCHENDLSECWRILQNGFVNSPKL